MQSGTYRVSQTWKFPPWARVSNCKLPREPFSIHRGEKNNAFVNDDISSRRIYCIYPFPKDHAPAYLSTEVFIPKNNFTTVTQYCSKETELNFQWFWYKYVDFIRIDSFTVLHEILHASSKTTRVINLAHKWRRSSRGIGSATCKRWNVIYNVKNIFPRKQQND